MVLLVLYCINVVRVSHYDCTVHLAELCMFVWAVYDFNVFLVLKYKHKDSLPDGFNDSIQTF